MMFEVIGEKCPIEHSPLITRLQNNTADSNEENGLFFDYNCLKKPKSQTPASRRVTSAEPKLNIFKGDLSAQIDNVLAETRAAQLKFEDVF